MRSAFPMFHYFGYGSNLDLTALRAKGVEPRESFRGLLRGWKLRFNVRHWFRHEGGVGNIERTGNPDDRVEGVVHHCDDADLAVLDALEARGVGYDRVRVDVETTHGPRGAVAYTGLPGALDETCLPTRRYLNIVVRGAVAAGLDPAYIAALRAHPVFSPPEYPPFVHPPDAPAVSSGALAASPSLTALMGAVFDMTGARADLAPVVALFGGRDMTLFHVKRLDTSTGTETLEDVRRGRLGAAAERYLNAYLHEYAAEFRYVGRIVTE